MNDLGRIAAAGIALAAGMSLAGCSISDVAARPAGPIPTQPGAVVVYINECGLDLVSTPRSLALSCADASLALHGLTWTDWGSPETKASGEEVARFCYPNCAAGKVRSVSVTVTASQLMVGRTASAYTLLTVVRHGGASSGFPAREVFYLDGPDARHTGGQRR